MVGHHDLRGFPTSTIPWFYWEDTKHLFPFVKERLLHPFERKGTKWQQDWWKQILIYSMALVQSRTMGPPWASFPPCCKHTWWPRGNKEKNIGKKQYGIPMGQPRLTSKLYELIAQNKKIEITWLNIVVNNYTQYPRGVATMLCPFHPHWIISSKVMFTGKESGWNPSILLQTVSFRKFWFVWIPLAIRKNVFPHGK